MHQLGEDGRFLTESLEDNVQHGCEEDVELLRKASVARVNRRLRRYYLIVRLLPNVFALACLS